MQALRLVAGRAVPSVDHLSKNMIPVVNGNPIWVRVTLETPEGLGVVTYSVLPTAVSGSASSMSIRGSDDQMLSREVENEISRKVQGFRVFQFDPKQMMQPASLVPVPELSDNGFNLPVVLDALRDSHPERFEQLNQELARWLPEYDRILFETRGQGQRAFMLRTRLGGYPIRATELSQGTLLALAFLTTAYLPQPPAIICFEEPEHGIHPRLLRNVQDAMYRLAYPENFGEDREPVQVIATTHSPYLLDLYRDHPEEIVIAEKTEDGAHFKRLVDTPYFHKIFEGEHLGELWYTGVFGGVPVAS